MKPRTLGVMFSFFSYGGNGGISSEVPDIRQWYRNAYRAATSDPRIHEVFEFESADTPITMTRNRAVLAARKAGADVLVMVDSDQKPDMYLGQPGVKPFFESSFDFIYENYDKGAHVIGAPYCGVPPEEIVYVFKWGRLSSLPNLPFDQQVDKYSRNEAAQMAGIQPAAGLPTGLIMFDMRIFDITEPVEVKSGELAKGWFYYEWTDKYATNKASTEDGTSTRDMSLIGIQKLGYNPVHCNWDAWAGHWKPYCVPKPTFITADHIAGRFAEAVKSNVQPNEKMIYQGDQASKEVLDFLAQEQTDASKFSELIDSKIADLTHGNSSVIDREVISRLVADHAKDDIAFEIGTFVGETAKLIVKSGARVVVCVDTFDGSTNDITGIIGRLVDLRAAFLENCKDEVAEGQIMSRKNDSLSEAKLITDGTIALVYIDANHEYEEVLADIKAWLPKVKPGGVIAGHDFDIKFQDGVTIAFPGVRKAVEEVFGEDFVKPVPGSSVWYHVVK